MTKQDAAREAVTTLGLLTPGAIPTITGLLSDDLIEHPRSICTRYRKTGEQISDEEKKRLGIRRNGFLSKAALSEISEAGLAEPLAAHERTLLRATFTMSRANAIGKADEVLEQVGGALIGWEHSTLNKDCPACNRLDHRVTAADQAVILPPSDCRPGCTAPYTIRPKFDWLHDID